MAMNSLEALSNRRSARVRRVPGEVGVWVFIFGDMTVFAVCFASYLYYRGQNRELFDVSQRQLTVGYGLANTLLLLTSSLAVVLAVGAMRGSSARRRWYSVTCLLIAFGCGLAFSALKVLEYGAKLSHGISPASNDFFMFYFVLTGLHFFHLVIGMAVLLALVRLVRRAPLTVMQFAVAEGGACYWHMVDLLWIVLFPLLYLIN
jgi:nitric oxide reductase NorE protein